MNSFNKTDAAIFLMQTVLPGGYLFSQLNYVLGRGNIYDAYESSRVSFNR